MALIRDADLIQDGMIPYELIHNCIQEHKKLITRYQTLEKYYQGKHAILNRTLKNAALPNNKLVCNHAEYITDMATGYFMNNPINYTCEGDITVLTDNLKSIDSDSHDTELARDISIYGVGYELIFATDDDIPIVDLAELSPMDAFLVVDDTVKHKPLFGVHYYPKYNLDQQVDYYLVNVYTGTQNTVYKVKDLENREGELINQEPHYFGDVPIIEYKNKKSLQGDFEQVITLIDAYNLLQSDRINDKEQLVDALLKITGASLGDDEEETSETAKTIKELKILELPEGADANWLIKQLNETETEVLKKSIKDDIHEFSKVPCLTDESFGGNNVSGVSLAYKLLAFEQLTKTKENFYTKGAKQRLKLMCTFHNAKAHNLDPATIALEYTRSLPINQVELVNMVVALDGVVSDETRLKLLWFVDDAKEELKKLKEELQDKVKIQQQEFGAYDFKQGNGVDGQEED